MKPTGTQLLSSYLSIFTVKLAWLNSLQEQNFEAQQPSPPTHQNLHKDLKPTRLAGARTRIPYGRKRRKAGKHAGIKAKNLTRSRADRRAQRMDTDSPVVDSAPREIDRRWNGGRQPSCPGKRRRAGRRGALLGHPHSRVGYKNLFAYCFSPSFWGIMERVWQAWIPLFEFIFQ
jgi:hypothetical protein